MQIRVRGREADLRMITSQNRNSADGNRKFSIELVNMFARFVEIEILVSRSETMNLKKYFYQQFDGKI